jgi:hypothetical protein
MKAWTAHDTALPFGSTPYEAETMSKHNCLLTSAPHQEAYAVCEIDPADPIFANCSPHLFVPEATTLC